MQKTRVAHLITNLALGGAQDYLLTVAQRLDKQKFEVYVMGRLEGEWLARAREIPDIQCLDVPSLRREISIFNDVASVFEIRRLLKNYRIDVLHTHSSKAGVVGRIAAALQGLKHVVHTVHGFPFHNFMPPPKKWLYTNVERYIARLTSVLLFVSEADRLQAERLRIRARLFNKTIYNGIDTAPFTRVDRVRSRLKFALPQDDYVVGFTGRLSEQKGLHILLKAFALVHQRSQRRMTLALLGEGDKKPELQKLAIELGVSESVRFFDFSSCVPDFLSALDLFVMTSLWEGLSRSLAEAMLAGIPVIASNVGGTSDVIRSGETGWLVPPDDVHATALAIQDAVENDSKAKHMALNGQRCAKKLFDLHAMIKHITSLYESFVVAPNNPLLIKR